MVKNAKSACVAVAGAVAASLAGAGAAQAHPGITPSEIPADGYARIEMSIPHGCGESPTTKVTVRLPDEVVSATPQVVPGWRISTKEGPLAAPYEDHGEKVTRGVREVTWTGGPLDAHHMQVFGMSIRLVGGKPGTSIPFKVLQKCKEGEMAWVEVPVEGQEQEPEHPAAMVRLAAPQGDHHGGTANDEGEGHGNDDDAPSKGLVVGALVLGAVGTLTGGTALLTGRRK
jgi:uncharacterized protein YcnI